MSAFSVTTRKSAPTVELRTLSFPLRTIRWEPVGRFVFCRVTNREESSNQVVIASHLLILEDRQTDRQSGRQVGRQTCRQADGNTDTHRHTQTHTHTHTLTHTHTHSE